MLVWKERNDRIFKGVATFVEDIMPIVFLRLAKWSCSRSEFDCNRVDDILYYWEATLHCGSRKIKIVLSCSSPSGVLKFNVDGAA